MEQGASPADTTWYKLEGKCVHCGGGDFTCEYGPRHFVLCSCCNNWGTHVECFEKHKNQTLTEEFINSGSCWFCGKGCEEIAAFFETQNGVRMPVRGEAAEYTLEVVRYDPDSRGARSVVDAAVKIFRDAFGRMTMPNGKDYIEMCCTAYESPDDEVGSDSDNDESTAVDFTGFRVVALRKGNQVVTVATLRLFGTQLAEMPYVATRPGFRRAGHCRRLLKGVEDMLRKLHVQWLVLPSVKSILTMWRYSFNFMPLTLEELASLEAHIISPDFGTVQLLKKRMWPPLAGQRGGSRASRGSRAATAAVAGCNHGKLAGQQGGSVRGRGSGARGLGAGPAAASNRGGQLQLKFGGSRRRRSRAAAASKAEGSASNADVESSSDGEDNAAAGSQQDEESQAAAEERAAAQAAWALFEQEKKQKGQQSSSSSSSSSDESDDQSSSDEDSDKPAAKRCSKKRKKVGKAGGDDGDYKGDASSSSNSSDSDSGLVSEEDGDLQRISKHKVQQQQHKRGAADTSAATATVSGSARTAAAAAVGGSAAESSGLPTQGERDAVLQQLRKEVEKAGGKLEDGWAVRLVGRTPTGNWRTKYFVAPGGAPVFTGILAAKRHLGLAPPLAGPHAAPLAAAAAAGGPGNKRQRTTGPDAGRTTAVSEAPQCPAGVAKRLRELRMGRARRRHMSDATIGVGLADAVKTFYTAAVTELVNVGSHQETLELQQQVECLQAQLECCYTSATSVTAQLSRCRKELAVVQAERDTLQVKRTAQENELAERDTLVASQRALIDSLTHQLACATTPPLAAAVAAVQKPLAAAAEVLPLADEMRLPVAAADKPVVAAVEPMPLAGKMQDPAAATYCAAEQPQAVIAQLLQLLETREAEIADLKQQLEATCSNTAPMAGAPGAAAASAAPSVPPLLICDAAAVLTAVAAGSVQQVPSVDRGLSPDSWDCQENLGSGCCCPDMLDVGSRGYCAVEHLSLDLTCGKEPTGTAKPSPTAMSKPLNYAHAACQSFTETAKPSPAAGDMPLDCSAATCQPFSTEASQQCGTQTLQFSEDQVADGDCEELPPARDLGCCTAATQQAEQRQQKPAAEGVAPLPPAHEVGCLAGATQQPEHQQQQQQQQHKADVETMTPLAVLPSRLVTEPAAAAAARAVAADNLHAPLSASIAAEAQTVVAYITAPAHDAIHATISATTAAAAAVKCPVGEMPLALLAAAAAAELDQTVTAVTPPHSSGTPGATTPFQQAALQLAAAAAATAPLCMKTAHALSSELPAVEQPVAVAAAVINRNTGAEMLSAAAAVVNSEMSTEAAAAVPLSSSRPSTDPTTAAATAPASGGSRLSDLFLSGLLPDVVGCLMRSPAFKQVTAQQQHQPHHCEQQQQQPGSPEVEQPLDRSKRTTIPNALKESVDAAAATPSQRRLPDCTAQCPVASAATAAKSPEAASPTAAAEPGSDEGSYHPSKSPSPVALATSPAAAVAAAPAVAHVSDGSSSSRGSRKRPKAGDQHDTVPAALVTPSRLGTKAASTAAAEGNKQPAEKRQRIHHHGHSSSSRHHKRTSSAVLDLFGDVALLEGLQELHSPGSSGKPAGSSSGGSSGSGSGASASGSGGVQGPGSGSSIRSGDNTSSASASHAPPPASALEARVSKQYKADGAPDVVMSDRETTPVQDACGEIPAGLPDKPQHQQQHTPCSDGGDSGLPDTLAEMFEHLAADMARDGMLPGNTARTAHSPDTQQALATNAAAAAANSESSRPQARQVASVLGPVGNTAAAAAGTGVGKITGSMLSAAAGIIDRATGVAVGATVAGVASSGVAFKQGLTKAASMVVDDELVAAGSVPVGTEENFAAALDTAALFAFAGDME